VFAVLAASACGSDNKQPDSGVVDSGVDSGTPDSGTPDSGTPDSGTPDSGTPDSGTPTATLSIAGFAFSPADFTVDPGTVITVANDDSVAHTVTSETADNSFSPGAVSGISFNTGSIAPGGSATITIPSDATSGAVVPYYCQIHTSGMSPANGHITIR
jgi:plastocyanin